MFWGGESDEMRKVVSFQLSVFSFQFSVFSFQFSVVTDGEPFSVSVK